MTSSSTVLQPLTLVFDDRNLETRFEAEYRDGAVRYYRLVAAMLLGFMVLISVTGLIVEFSVNRTGIQVLLWYAMIPLTVMALAALFTNWGAQKPQFIVGIYVMLMAGVCIFHTRVRGDQMLAETYGYSYTAFLLFLLLAFSRFPPAKAIISAALIVAAYAIVLGSWLGFDTIAGHVSILLGACALGFGVGYLMERNVRLLFAARAEVERRERLLAESEAKLREERDKSEALLLSVLPQSIAARLKAEGRSIADGIVECTVLFSDMVGFTRLSQEMGPRALVALLNDLFSRFDALSDKHGLEKIKTIGDAYMAAAGVPDYMETHPVAAANMALDMIGAMAEFNRERKTSLSLRIGLHSGPVVAGIIGTRKFSYDLWGDAVNTAARMESHGTPGRIQVTEISALQLKRTHDLEDRGVIDVKGKGPMRTYWLCGLKT